MLLGAIADDFTGASDLANTLAQGGMAARLLFGIPTSDFDGEAGVIALKTRSCPVHQAVEQSLEALRWLQAQGCQQYVFKYCSTFDSTPEGNIGPVAEALLDALSAPGAVVCPAFPANGRTVYRGHLFVRDRLLSESGMETHPLNPMTDPDLRRWLKRQCRGGVGQVPYETVRQGPQAVRAALDAEFVAGRRLCVVDAIDEADLLAIGAAAARDALVTGGSGVALGLPANFRSAGLLRCDATQWSGAKGPGVALSGSCSRATRSQLSVFLKSHPGFQIDSSRIFDMRNLLADAVAFFVENADQAPVFYSSAEPEAVAAAQARWGVAKLAEAFEAFFAELAPRLIELGARRLVVAGGETSGAVVSGLRLGGVEVGPEIDPGVPALRHDSGLVLALKSGNFGADDFFAKALVRLAE